MRNSNYDDYLDWDDPEEWVLDPDEEAAYAAWMSMAEDAERRMAETPIYTRVCDIYQMSPARGS